MSKTETEATVTCNICGGEYKNEHGLDIHKAKAHKEDAPKEAPKTKKKTTSKRKKAKTRVKAGRLNTPSNGHTATGVRIDGDKLTITTQDGSSSTFKFDRPSLIIDLYEDARGQALGYAQQLVTDA